MKKISVSLSKTINVGNYESVRIQASIETDIKDDANIDEAYGKVWAIVEEEIIYKEEMVRKGE